MATHPLFTNYECYIYRPIKANMVISQVTYNSSNACVIVHMVCEAATVGCTCWQLVHTLPWNRRL